MVCGLECFGVHTNCLQPAILISRFLLNLRQVEPGRTDQEQASGQHKSYLSGIRFTTPNSFLGNIGEPLDLVVLESTSQGTTTYDGDTVEASQGDLVHASSDITATI